MGVIVLILKMKKAFLIIVVLLGFGILVLHNLPLEIIYRTEIKRGNELIENIENHKSETGEIPKSTDWETLHSIGFSKDEMETAYPEIRHINESTFELIYTIGFDPPYLMWNSKERIWKKDFPTQTEEWKNKK